MKTQINIVSVSGGSDSTRLYMLAIEFYGADFIPIFADTGHEHPVTLNYVANMHHIFSGPEVVTVRPKIAGPEQSPFLNLAIKKKRWPSAKAQFCTEWLKLAPIKAFLLSNYPQEEYDWFMHTGIIREESFKRSTMQPFAWNHYFDCLSIMPLLYESKELLKLEIENSGGFLNPLYTLGKSSRVGCYPCIHANKNELRNLDDWAWDRLVYYEKQSGHTFFGPNHIPGVNIPSALQVKNWSRTSHGGSQFSLFDKSGESKSEDVPSCVSGFHSCSS